MQIITKNDKCQESHWRELNSRPTPYQGVAIPLSHSGVNFTNRDFGLIATEKKSKDYIQELHHWQFTVLHIRMQPHKSMIGTNMLIYSLAGVVVLLSVILFVRVIRSRPTVSPDPWQTPLPMNTLRQRRRAPRPMVVPPPPQMFQQRRY